MNKKPVKHIAVTGGAGQIAYSLLFRIGSGEVFGEDQPIILHILEIPESMKALEGVKMELNDCAFPLIEEIEIGTDPYTIFSDADYALLIGAKPRGPGMERRELLLENGKIFIEQGKALNQTAKRDVQVIVIGNPCNTNCLIAMKHAPKIPRKNFHALTRLDQNRAVSLLANKAGVNHNEIENVIIWGNHSSTQVPDISHAKIQNRPALEMIQNKEWIEKDFPSQIRKRGAQIIEKRGKSSAASAANAIIDAVQALIFPKNQWFSSGVCSDGNPYGIPENLIFSFPCQSTGKGEFKIVENLSWNSFIRSEIEKTVNELIEERKEINI